MPRPRRPDEGAGAAAPPLLLRVRLRRLLLGVPVSRLRLLRVGLLLRISVAGLRRIRLLRLLCVRVRLSVGAWALLRRIGHVGVPRMACASIF